jgi:prepilin-type N-terminal cleavage/methylation domain-containing protein
MKNPMTATRGFSLIELLVVISIVTVLIAVLLPSLKAARETALAVKCQANMKQFGLAWNNYAGDWKGTVPGQFYSWQTNKAYWSYLGADAKIQAANLVACPANPFRASNWTQQSNYFFYAYVNLHDIRYPSDGFWTCETPVANGSTSYTPMTTTVTEVPGMWFGHPNATATNLFYDLHIAVRRMEEIPVRNDLGGFRHPGFFKYWQPNLNSRLGVVSPLPWK